MCSFSLQIPGWVRIWRWALGWEGSTWLHVSLFNSFYVLIMWLGSSTGTNIPQVLAHYKNALYPHYILIHKIPIENPTCISTQDNTQKGAYMCIYLGLEEAEVLLDPWAISEMSSHDVSQNPKGDVQSLLPPSSLAFILTFRTSPQVTLSIVWRFIYCLIVPSVLCNSWNTTEQYIFCLNYV